MKYTVVMDSFKGCLTSTEVCEAVKKGILKSNINNDVIAVPLADGGEGTMDTFASIFNGKIIEMDIIDLNQRKAIGYFCEFINPNNKEKYAVIDTATTAGILLSKKYGKKIMSYSTYGTGKQIMDLIDMGYQNIIVGLGGSGTNDGGIGALTAFGAKIKNTSNHFVDGRRGPSIFHNISSIDLATISPSVTKANIIALYDSKVVLTGNNGASLIYSPQKGANKDTSFKLDEYLERYSSILKQLYNFNPNDYEGSGAAGGLATALLLIGAKLKKGADELIYLSDLENTIKNSDVIITGEGKTDFQTATGKLPTSISTIAKKYNKPVICICGAAEPTDELYAKGIDSIFSIANKPITYKESFENAAQLLEITAFNVANLLKNYENNN